VLDEPTTGMDEQGVRYLEGLIHELVKENKTILAVHHDVSAVRRLDGHVHVVNRHLVDSGSVAEVLVPEKIERLFNHYSIQPAPMAESESVKENQKEVA
ncbi:metal ABC transporter ATP-binding protein, partial [Photobacterium profundum]